MKLSFLALALAWGVSEGFLPTSHVSTSKTLLQAHDYYSRKDRHSNGNASPPPPKSQSQNLREDISRDVVDKDSPYGGFNPRAPYATSSNPNQRMMAPRQNNNKASPNNSNAKPKYMLDYDMDDEEARRMGMPPPPPPGPMMMPPPPPPGPYQRPSPPARGGKPYNGNDYDRDAFMARATPEIARAGPINGGAGGSSFMPAQFETVDIDNPWGGRNTAKNQPGKPNPYSYKSAARMEGNIAQAGKVKATKIIERKSSGSGSSNNVARSYESLAASNSQQRRRDPWEMHNDRLSRVQDTGYIEQKRISVPEKISPESGKTNATTLVNNKAPIRTASTKSKTPKINYTPDINRPFADLSTPSTKRVADTGYFEERGESEQDAYEKYEIKTPRVNYTSDINRPFNDIKTSSRQRVSSTGYFEEVGGRMDQYHGQLPPKKKKLLTESEQFDLNARRGPVDLDDPYGNSQYIKKEKLPSKEPIRDDGFDLSSHRGPVDTLDPYGATKFNTFRKTPPSSTSTTNKAEKKIMHDEGFHHGPDVVDRRGKVSVDDPYGKSPYIIARNQRPNSRRRHDGSLDPRPYAYEMEEQQRRSGMGPARRSTLTPYDRRDDTGMTTNPYYNYNRGQSYSMPDRLGETHLDELYYQGPQSRTQVPRNANRIRRNRQDDEEEGELPDYLRDPYGKYAFKQDNSAHRGPVNTEDPYGESPPGYFPPNGSRAKGNSAGVAPPTTSKVPYAPPSAGPMSREQRNRVGPEQANLYAKYQYSYEQSPFAKDNAARRTPVNKDAPYGGSPFI